MICMEYIICMYIYIYTYLYIYITYIYILLIYKRVYVQKSWMNRDSSFGKAKVVCTTCRNTFLSHTAVSYQLFMRLLTLQIDG